VNGRDLRVHRVPLGSVHLPAWHPRAHEGACPVFGYAIDHPDGVILFDTGVGTGNAFIDEVYRPDTVPIVAALARLGIDERDVVAIVNSHLHFDHCGQNDEFHARRVPIHVQAAEMEAARSPGYTVPEWAAIPDGSIRLVHGDERIADGVRIVATPGHTPGHQSVEVDTPAGPVIVAGQCAYKITELVECRVAPDNMHDETLLDAGQESLERLLSLRPRRIVVAHDADPWPRTAPDPDGD
jgi:N-acyl homoserine lactone hydrolase